MRCTLLVDSASRPLRMLQARRAVQLCHLKRVEVRDAYPECIFVQIYEDGSFGVAPYMQWPRVVALRGRFSGKVQRHPPLSRRNLLIRDDYSCQYCGCLVTTKASTIDHVLPSCRGGEWSWENLVIACAACNQAKADRLPEEAGMWLRKQPMAPRLSPKYFP